MSEENWGSWADRQTRRFQQLLCFPMGYIFAGGRIAPRHQHGPTLMEQVKRDVKGILFGPEVYPSNSIKQK